MRRLSASLLLLLLLPLGVAAQQLMDVPVSSTGAISAEPGVDAGDRWVVPVWRAPDGRLLALIGAEQQTQFSVVNPHDQNVSMPGLMLPNGGTVASAGLSYQLTPKLYSSLSFNKLTPALLSEGCASASLADARTCNGSRQGWQSGALVGGFRSDAMFLDFGLNWLQHDPSANGLLLIMPDATNGSVLGIPSQWVDSLSGVDAKGSLRLGDSGTRLNMGASMGRMRLLPGRVRVRPDGVRLFSGFDSGVDAIDQKALSLGVGKGSVSGSIVGRLMQPVGGDKLSGLDHQWSAIDLGITVRLPWEGELSLGAQNLWSSGSNANLPSKDADPTQNRIPYIQYHQEL